MTEEVTNVEQQAQPVQLQLNDIATMVQLIDLVSRRGGFEGPELEAIGGLRTRIVNFLNAASAQSQKQPEPQIPVEDVAVEEVETDGSAD